MQFQVPIDVQQIKSGYAAKPLFIPQLVQTANDLYYLNTKLNRELVQDLEKLAKANRHDELSRWAFCKALTQQRVSLALELLRRFVLVIAAAKSHGFAGAAAKGHRPAAGLEVLQTEYRATLPRLTLTMLP